MGVCASDETTPVMGATELDELADEVKHMTPAQRNVAYRSMDPDVRRRIINQLAARATSSAKQMTVTDDQMETTSDVNIQIAMCYLASAFGA